MTVLMNLKRWLQSLLDSIKGRHQKPEPKEPQRPEGYDDAELSRDGYFWIKVVSDD